jgi:hypothetical protein
LLEAEARNAKMRPPTHVQPPSKKKTPKSSDSNRDRDKQLKLTMPCSCRCSRHLDTIRHAIIPG